MSVVVEKALKSTFPNGPTWGGMTDGTMREISDGVAKTYDRERSKGRQILLDMMPETTTLLKEWEQVFKLPSGDLLTDAQRRARLQAAWTTLTPGNYTQMNEIYALSGLNVVARPLEPGEDPRIIADSDQQVKVWDAVTGPNSVCGSTRCGAFTLIQGTTETIVFADGRPGPTSLNYITVCGVARTGLLSASSRCGNFEGSRQDPPDPTIPDDVWTWALIYIIEGPDGNFAEVPIELRPAFNFLTYKIKPNFMWAITRVDFV